MMDDDSRYRACTKSPDDLLDALNRGESLPSSWYTDPAITEQEIEKIFRKSWQYVGSVQQLRNVGDYITGYVGGIPVVVLRNERGISGFINVCRHRRHEVMKDSGNCKFMQCGYHAWTYDLNGRLKAAPRSDREGDFCKDDYPLLSIEVDTLGPFIFANATENAAGNAVSNATSNAVSNSVSNATHNTAANTTRNTTPNTTPNTNGHCQPLHSCYGELLEIIKESGLDLANLELWSRESWQSEANWKTMLENFLECYHCPVAHPGFSAIIDVDQDNYTLIPYQWFSSQVGHVRQSALDGSSKIENYNPVGSLMQAQYHLLWPNTTISINPGFPNLSIDVWLPFGPNQACGFSEHYFAPGVDKQLAEELIRFNREVGTEDDRLTNSVQRGLLGGRPSVGRFLSASEQLCIHFQKLIVNALCDN